MLDLSAPRRPSRAPPHRSSHQLQAEKCNKMENEALRRNVRLLDSSAQRFSDGMYRQKQQLSHQLEATRQTSGHSAVSLRPDNARDLDRVLKTRWFHDSSGRVSEKELRRWRATEQDLVRRGSAGVHRPEMTQRERNRRLALTELLRTTGLLDKKTKKELLPHADFFPQIDDLEGSEEDDDEEELRLDTASSSQSARLRAQFPRAFAFCCQSASASTSASAFSSASTSASAFSSASASASAFSSRSESAGSRQPGKSMGRLVAIPHSASPSLLRPRPPSLLRPTLSASQIEEDEESIAEAEEEEGEEEEEEERSSFSALPKWKRDLMIEAPMFAGEAPTEAVRLAISKSQLRRDLQELKAENLRRSRLLHASNMKKVFL